MLIASTEVENRSRCPNNIYMYEYNLKLTRVIDGDTIEGMVDLGFGIHMKKKIRLLGINAPETKLQRKIKNVMEREKEKQMGLMAKAKLRELLKGQKITIKTELDKTGKFGRVLGTLYTHASEEPLNVNEFLLSHGFADEY